MSTPNSVEKSAASKEAIEVVEELERKGFIPLGKRYIITPIIQSAIDKATEALLDTLEQDMKNLIPINSRAYLVLKGFRDSDVWSPIVNRLAKSALPHDFKSEEDTCELCGENRADLIHFPSSAPSSSEASILRGKATAKDTTEGKQPQEWTLEYVGNLSVNGLRAVVEAHNATLKP